MSFSEFEKLTCNALAIILLGIGKWVDTLFPKDEALISGIKADFDNDDWWWFEWE